MTPRWLWPLLLALTLVRLGVAAVLPLTPDEAYYWIWSRIPQAGYPDHPPMVALWIRAGTALCGRTALGVRLFGPLSALAGSWLVWAACRDLCVVSGRDQARAWRAPILLNATLMIGLGCALMTPDTPLTFVLALALWAFARLMRTGRPAWWLLIGLALGLGFDSKYTGLLVAGGLACWLVANRSGRAWLSRPMPWAGAGLAFIAMLPVLAWNARHHWISLVRQGGRAGDWQPARAPQFLGELFGGQIGLATPLVFCVFGLAIWRARRIPAAYPWLWMVLLPCSVFVQHALGARVQANWPVVLYPSLAVLAGCFMTRIAPAAVLGFVVTGLVYLQATTGIVPLSPHRDPAARETAGWADLAAETTQWIGTTPLSVPEYGLASELAFYGVPHIVGLDPRWKDFAAPEADIRPNLILARADERPDPAWERAGGFNDICRHAHARIVQCYRFYRASGDAHSSIAAIDLPPR
ncbi:glycosyltransferase family 39 protein [Tanticharoenia sakaeratensis]|uniref:4-amino-4-deoxy-L-arabinose transferase n=1 Tax=Tanticharoenia sakaeratensis NBRC 103193 TaxID=1231623 RepID=A0A0D6MNW1_9PROT|nr:glycosyltransferase family 39 protein [Tanticharoenia sakaeratensis]GAN55100.1 4-amino-4-deoxy-L-arabinose transferase [Tanticharoenia sakaeratensis NBRC 103193]GBQ20214.1 glycosyl/arabinosyl/mannosyl transferase [Tanticharoenia sakaeratensis NBRC 103193]